MGLYDKICACKRQSCGRKMFPRAAHYYSDRDRNMDLCESYRFFHDNTCDENTVFL